MWVFLPQSIHVNMTKRREQTFMSLTPWGPLAKPALTCPNPHLSKWVLDKFYPNLRWPWHSSGSNTFLKCLPLGLWVYKLLQKFLLFWSLLKTPMKTSIYSGRGAAGSNMLLQVHSSIKLKSMLKTFRYSLWIFISLKQLSSPRFSLGMRKRISLFLGHMGSSMPKWFGPTEWFWLVCNYSRLSAIEEVQPWGLPFLPVVRHHYSKAKEWSRWHLTYIKKYLSAYSVLCWLHH